jgi:uncharacterized BrkB/YihY/UPF0761 family membrane protein
MQPETYTIHHINPTFNRFFSPLIFVFAMLVVFLMTILPYRGRIFLAFLINVFFNRPVVYLNIISRKLAYPLQKLNVFVVYFIIFGLFALIYKIFFRQPSMGFIRTKQKTNTDKFSSQFQS